MDPTDTNIGGRERRFRTTNWSQILAAGDPSHPRCAEHWEELVHTYWKPVYCYVRAAWKKSNEDAKDLTQAFFAYLLEKGYLARMRPEQGSFRGYLKRALSHFLIDADRHQEARSPTKAMFSIDARPELFERLGPASAEETPETAFDREWFRCVLEESIQDLEGQLVKQGKAVYFKVFSLYCLDLSGASDPARTTTLLQKEGSSEPTYREIGERLGIRESDVRNYLSSCRTELRRILRDRIRDYVADEKDVESELLEVLRG